ncbi:MAG: hypothetical protein A3F83_08335 [Candidatus Glassbacteria bacterium RIFCSPLOWO2_12_FULL_58_11]|uniref:CBS domain-containing protein n=2 Tax=Candidatus Glassiibacteriota TaxID=1817805 RepID=A0A1F5YYA9_9BACT|nr:MAG: hypothetical protein A2Z86_12395 [Candidatus Glassbacteria bacterium GWA2_58_10]OGG05178.1 MAG: hypothetical protein A3F83_08335 [Candidatus Glassbacteria bacterium RIFCSPLOWO2_12_FULL_58_11]
MTRKVVLVRGELTINELIEIFLENKISSAPVVDDNNELIGIVTKTDILGHFMDMDLDLTLTVGLRDLMESHPEQSDLEVSAHTDLTVRQIMTTDPITVEENIRIEQLAGTMVEKGIHRLIVTKGKSVVGIVSTLDILHFVSGKEKDESGK